MKKTVSFLLVLGMIFTLAGCSGKEKNGSASNSGSNAMREKFDQLEYSLYTNIFYNETGSDYEGKQFTKAGSFGKIYDAYSSTERYYVWGFADQTKCCDFQWEIVLPDGVTPPANGSYVTMTGTFTKSSEALDGYWFTDVELTVEQKYTGDSAKYDYDLSTLSATLARVQIANMESFPEIFEGRTALVYGRAFSASVLQHPYYDETWYLDFVNAGKVPATGQYLLLGGTLVNNGGSAVLDVVSYTETV